MNASLQVHSSGLPESNRTIQFFKCLSVFTGMKAKFSYKTCIDKRHIEYTIQWNESMKLFQSQSQSLKDHLHIQMHPGDNALMH